MKYKKISDYFGNITEIILHNRGVENVKQYLDPDTIPEFSHNLLNTLYYGRDAMYLICSIIKKCIDNKYDIDIIVDSDCDGFESASELANYFYDLSPKWTCEHVHFIFHEGKKHGINTNKIGKNTKVLIVPDAGTNDVKECEELRKRNIPVIILDHHDKEEENSYPIIINNQIGDYPNKEISGSGVVYKFLKYMDLFFHVKYSENYVEQAAIGMIGDMMNISSMETKGILHRGICNIKNPFTIELVSSNEKISVSTLNISDIAFYVCPYINAINRSGTIEEKELIFNSMLKYKAYTLIESKKRRSNGEQVPLVKEAIRVATNVKARQRKSIERTKEILDSKINLEDSCILIICDKDEVDSNLAGLIANDYTELYQRPCAILTKNEKICTGSARGFELCGIKDFKKECQDSKSILWAKGHPNAFGLSLEEEKAKDFILYMNSKIGKIGEHIYYVDFIWKESELMKSRILDISKLYKLWGTGMGEPIIAIENVEVTGTNLKILGKNKNTIKISSKDKISFIMFNAEDIIEKYSLLDFKGYLKLNVVGYCKANEWNGYIYPQIQIEELEVINR